MDSNSRIRSAVKPPLATGLDGAWLLTVVATEALARPNALRLALLGYGEQAETHARAIQKVRKLESITVWGRDLGRARSFSDRMALQVGVAVTPAATVREAVADADIICTLTSAYDPILKAEWVRPGTHINAIGSSYAGPAELDNELVARSRFIADSREDGIRQAGKYYEENMKMFGELRLVRALSEEQIEIMRDRNKAPTAKLPRIDDAIKVVVKIREF